MLPTTPSWADGVVDRQVSFDERQKPSFANGPDATADCSPLWWFRTKSRLTASHLVADVTTT
jgi:hypothetical protein